jgi:acetyl-CoA carboxylase biotin carboxyl carrier protein
MLLNDEYPMSNDEIESLAWLIPYSIIRAYFVICHSGFVIDQPYVDLTLLGKPLYVNALLFISQESCAVDLKDIKALIDLMKKNDLSVFEMEKDGFRIKLQKGLGDQPIISSTAAPTLMAPAVTNGPGTSAESASLKDIVSPMVGTFYEAASPDASPFVDVGTKVNEDTVVCIIEAMKVMNEIKAETSGVIAEVVAENSKPVQFGQVLFRVR